MLKLATSGREPFWLDLVPGVHVQFRTITVAAILVARQAAADVLKAGGDDAVTLAGLAFTRSLARAGILAWEGVGDAEGAPVEPSPDTIDAFLDLWPVFDAVDRLYVAPALVGLDEKNGSSPLPNGTSAGAKATAPRARKAAAPAHTGHTHP
jgi:hypothetical protein